MLARLIWLALGAFAVGTETFVVAALLPSIASDLHVAVSGAGQIVTAFAFAYAIGSPLLSVLAAEIDRKRLLVSCLLFFSVANVFAATAQSLFALTLARILLALASGLYVPNANAVAAAIAGPERRGQAIAIVVGGLTVAVALGVPVGAWLAATTSWQAAFLLVAAIGVIAALGLVIGLPRDLPRGTSTLRERLGVARRPEILHGLAVTLAFATGVFTVFTFLAPLLMSAAGLGAAGVSGTLFLFGVAAAAGNALGGYAADRFGAVPTVRAGLGALACAFVLLGFAAKALPVGLAAIVIVAAIGLWGVCGWGLYAAQMAYLAGLAPQVAMVTLSLNSSTFYLGVAMGSLLGGLVLSLGSIADLGWIAALGQVVALVILHLPRPALEQSAEGSS